MADSTTPAAAAAPAPAPAPAAAPAATATLADPTKGPVDKTQWVATDAEFTSFIAACDDDQGWTVTYQADPLIVFVKTATNSSVNIIKIKTTFPDIEPEVLYDVLHDHYFRRTWDDHMIEGSIVQQVDATNEVGYYSCKMPFPLANRDYCNHRSWRIFPDTHTWVIFNKSVIHPDCPERAKFTRGWSYLSGYMMRKRQAGGTDMSYYTQNDPRGWIPPFLINMVSSRITPNLVSAIHANALKYPAWKTQNRPDWKPWITGYDPAAAPYQRHDPAVK